MATDARTRILEAAADLLERQGYHGTGMNEIVSESGTPRGSLYHYFPDGKDDLVAQAITMRMQEAIAHTERFLDDGANVAEAIYDMIATAARQVEEQGFCTGSLAAAVAFETSHANERLRQACADGYERLCDVIATRLTGQAGLREPHATALAHTIVSTMEGAAILSRTRRDGEILVQVAEQMSALVRRAGEERG